MFKHSNCFLPPAVMSPTDQMLSEQIVVLAHQVADLQTRYESLLDLVKCLSEQFDTFSTYKVGDHE